MKDIIVYSKKDGTNKLLNVSTSDVLGLPKFIEEVYPDEKHFVYILVDGVEIKLF